MNYDNNLRQIRRLLRQNLILATISLILTSMIFALVFFCPNVQEKLSESAPTHTAP